MVSPLFVPARRYLLANGREPYFELVAIFSRELYRSIQRVSNACASLATRYKSNQKYTTAVRAILNIPPPYSSCIHLYERQIIPLENKVIGTAHKSVFAV